MTESHDSTEAAAEDMVENIEEDIEEAPAHLEADPEALAHVDTDPEEVVHEPEADPEVRGRDGHLEE